MARRNTNKASVLRNYFAGGMIRKTETNVFEIRWGFGFGFRPQKGVWGMNAGGILFGFSAGLFFHQFFDCVFNATNS